MSRQDLQSTIVNRDSLEADVASAKAALELAQIDLQNTRLSPPPAASWGRSPCVLAPTSAPEPI
jgi:multidrug efflux pump subunit AcrA (membrane-fusion protein)